MQRCLTEWVEGAAHPRPSAYVCDCDTHTPAYVLIIKGCESLGLKHQELN